MLLNSTIANGGSLGSALAPAGLKELIGIVMPAAWTAAAMTFQVSPDGTTWQDLVNDAGTELNFTVAAAQNVGLRGDARAILGRWPHVRPRSGTSAAPVNQGAARTVGLLFEYGAR